MTRYLLTKKSSNAKTGPIPVTTVSSDTCPDVCPFKAGGCYAKHSHLGRMWARLDGAKAGGDDTIPHGTGSKDVLTIGELFQEIKALPDGQLWRHAQAGDLPGEGDKIDALDLCALVAANQRKRGFTYTHKPMNAENAALVRFANEAGFTVNLSANNYAHADALKALDVGPVVTVMPSDATRNTFTPAGNKVVVCPATQHDDVTCDTCQLCQRRDRKVIVGFPAHGSGANKVNDYIYSSVQKAA